MMLRVSNVDKNIQMIREQAVKPKRKKEREKSKIRWKKYQFRLCNFIHSLSFALKSTPFLCHHCLALSPGIIDSSSASSISHILYVIGSPDLSHHSSTSGLLCRVAPVSASWSNISGKPLPNHHWRTSTFPWQLACWRACRSYLGSNPDRAHHSSTSTCPAVLAISIARPILSGRPISLCCRFHQSRTWIWFLELAYSRAASVYSNGCPQLNHQSREMTCPFLEARSTASAIEPRFGGGTRSGCCSNACFHHERTSRRPWRDAFMGMRSSSNTSRNILWWLLRKYSRTFT